MYIHVKHLDHKHWITDYIPISYESILSNNQLNKSLTFYWNSGFNLHAICRAYYIDAHEIQIGDLWINEEFRGKKINGKKISVIFMKKIISKIWKQFKKCNKITLLVHNNNIPAIKLYEKLNFKIVKSNINIKKFNMINGLKMIRFKK